MEIIEVNSTEFSEQIAQPYHTFNTSAFNKHNSIRCEKVYYLLFKDNKYRLGIIFGLQDNVLKSPFSAPFGGFSFLKDDIKIQQIDQALNKIDAWVRSKGYEKIQITLPPSIYEESFISKQMNCFYRNGFQLSNLDLNYAFDLSNFTNDYENTIWRNARKNLKASFKSSFVFKKCESIQDKEKAYSIIKKNREERGYPLHLSWKQVKENMNLIQADFFTVQLNEIKTVAAAMIYHVSQGIVQVVYWGDLPEFSHLKTMNFLSYKIFEFYKDTSVEIVDIGPSTENSIPNAGLCEFKESIGCDISTKLTFLRNINK